MPRRCRLHWSGAATVSLAVAVALASCTPGAGSSPGANRAPSGAINVHAGTMGKVEVSLLDCFTSGSDDAWMIDVVGQFHKQYPNITITRTSMSCGDVMQALPRKLKSADPPDIVPANNGWQSLGVLVQGHLVLNLDRYSESYGWLAKIPVSIQREHEFSADGKQMGTGSLFGMPIARSSTIEAYYNRALLRKIGATVPHTLGQFESDLAKAKAAGITPISLGNLEPAGITGPLYSVMNSLGQQDKITDLIYSQKNVQIDDPATGFQGAVAKVTDWADKGYFTSQFSSVPGHDAAQAFVDGDALFRFDYSGSLPLKPGQSKGFGSFVLPRQDGGSPVATNASATNFSVSAKAKHPDAAAAFLSYAADKTAAGIAVTRKTMPLLAPDATTPTSDDPLFADDLATAAQLTHRDASVPYLDWATPTLLGTIQTNMQDLLAGKTSPADVVKAARADDSAFQAKLAK
jgi:raffinose/stachyose/melibiose transport system substrate-binding protein